MDRIRGAVRRLGVVGELMGFLWKEKMWWMIPLFVALLIVAGLAIFASSPVVAPFVYTLF
jgi:hypothetical protein